MSDATPPGRPTLAVVNARIATGDPRRPWADALAATGELLTVVGSSAEVRKLVAASTRVIDAGGRLLTGTGSHPLVRGQRADFHVVDGDGIVLTASAGVVTSERP